MRYIVGKDWRDFFDVIIVQARKPKFFTDESRPIRLYDTESQTQLWDRVTRLEKGQIYYEVCYYWSLKINFELLKIWDEWNK